jgi:hypothetical protein
MISKELALLFHSHYSSIFGICSAWSMGQTSIYSFWIWLARQSVLFLTSPKVWSSKRRWWRWTGILMPVVCKLWQIYLVSPFQFKMPKKPSLALIVLLCYFRLVLWCFKVMNSHNFQPTELYLIVSMIARTVSTCHHFHHACFLWHHMMCNVVVTTSDQILTLYYDVDGSRLGWI